MIYRPRVCRIPGCVCVPVDGSDVCAVHLRQPNLQPVERVQCDECGGIGLLRDIKGFELRCHRCGGSGEMLAIYQRRRA